MTDSIPTAAPDDLTYRVAWEIVAQAPAQVTVRIRREPDAGDSDGIPVVVDHEVSLRGTVSSDKITGQLAEALSPADKVSVLMWLCELAFRHGHGDAIEYPILVPDGGVRILVLKWVTFTRWFGSLAQFDFGEFVSYLRSHGATVKQRACGIAFLRQVAAVLPTIRQFDDQPHYLLEL